MKSNKLRIEYNQILSDLLLLQYRIELLRRNAQVIYLLDDDFGKSVGCHLDSVLCDFVKLGERDFLSEPCKSNWWNR
jgi:hypothetical protein